MHHANARSSLVNKRVTSKDVWIDDTSFAPGMIEQGRPGFAFQNSENFGRLADRF